MSVDCFTSCDLMYKYTGNIATLVCYNGHLGVPLENAKCKHCGEDMKSLLIVTRTTRIPAVICGYDDNGRAVVRYEDGATERFDEEYLYKFFVCTAVGDWPLLLSRLFSWGIVTGK